MFWGITIENGKRYSQIVDSSFHVSMAALECSSEDNNKKSKPISVMIEHEKTEYLLCTLNNNSQLQQALDLNFIEGEEVTFFINGHGPGAVHLTGYLIDSNEDMNESSDLEMDDDDSEEESENLSGSNLKRKRANDMENMKKMKKKKIVDQAKDEDSDEDEEESDDSDTDEQELMMSSKKTQPLTKEKKINLNQKGKMNIENSVQKTPKPAFQGNQNKTPKQDGNKGPQSVKKTPGGKPNVQENQADKTPQNGLNAPGSSIEGSKKKKKKRKKKNKNLDSTLDSSQNESKGTISSPEPATPNQKSKLPNTPKTPAQKKAGGTIVEDVTIGSGPVAKDGKFVHITYEGKLPNNKVFDSAKKNPLKFRLGKGEVIKGMDAGIEGMKVGGKRRITIPPNQGYGSKQVGPIPPNSTLIFEIELKAVS